MPSWHVQGLYRFDFDIIFPYTFLVLQAASSSQVGQTLVSVFEIRSFARGILGGKPHKVQ